MTVPENTDPDSAPSTPPLSAAGTEIAYRAWRLERRRRLLILGFVLPTVFALLGLLLRVTVPELQSWESGYATGIQSLVRLSNPVTLLFLLLLATFGLAMLYLQSGFRRPTVRDAALYQYEDELRSMRQQLDRHLTEAADIRRQLAERPRDTGVPEALPEQQQAELLKILEARIRQAAPEALLSDLESAARNQAIQARWVNDVSTRLDDSLKRLGREVQALGRRGNLNLALGTATTVAGLVLLGYFVLLTTVDLTEPKTFAIRFIPRLTLVVFIELFAYFFLRLYKSSLLEIKFFQNEMTNVELKAVALLAAAHLPDTDALLKSLETLGLTERNRILEKGQTTVELLRTKADSDGVTETLKQIVSILKRDSKGTV